MAATEIHFREYDLVFLASWRQRHGACLFLLDETGKRAALLPMFELPTNPHGKFDQRTAHALREKFEHVDEVFRELA